MPQNVRNKIKSLAKEAGFSGANILSVKDFKKYNQLPSNYNKYLEKKMYGDMDYLKKKLSFFYTPEKILPDVKSVLVVTMNYLTNSLIRENWQEKSLAHLNKPEKSYISLYARGRDYHKVLKNRLKALAKSISEVIGDFGYRACVDSAPLFEIELAQLAGLGWRGKNTLLLNKESGSMFFLGALLMDCKLVSMADKKKNHCGSCTACMDVCPTDAFVGPYQLDASRCVSYLTIEHKGIIPEDLRPLIGNRVYGCDDCQLVCPWNKFAKVSQVPDFDVRNGLSNSTLLELFDWSEKDFYERHRGSSILRIGYPRWLRNLAVALGNSSQYFNQVENNGAGRAREKRAVMLSLSYKVQKGCDLVAPHALWALQRLESKD